MTQAMTKADAGNALEAVIAQGDLSKLTPDQRVSYYTAVCNSIGLNPLTKPFEYITLNGKLTLYARKDATDQLRDIKKVSIAIASREQIGDVYSVTARATTGDGRTDESIGAVAIGNLKGDALANALMKAETKAKRRVTLSICGLGMLDETELETIPNARPVNDAPVKTMKTVDPTPDRAPELITESQMADLTFLLDALSDQGVTDEQLLAGVNRLAGTHFEDLEQNNLGSLTNAAAAKLISAFGRKLDERIASKEEGK